MVIVRVNDMVNVRVKGRVKLWQRVRIDHHPE